jgi:hypothetical protein
LIDTYLARRPSKIGDKIRAIGEPVPEAHLWRLTDGMVRSGRLRPVQMSEAVFVAAVTKHCPDHATAIYDKLGLDQVEVPAVRRGRPRKAPGTVVTAPPVERVDSVDEDE